MTDGAGSKQGRVGMGAVTSLLQLGTAKVDITPRLPIHLAGFGSRRSLCEDVSQRLYARAWLFKRNDGTGNEGSLLLVQGDLIWWGSEWIAPMSQRITEKWGIPPDRTLFHASHTHGGPQTTRQFCDSLGIMEPSYIHFLMEQVDHAVQIAHDCVETVTVERGSGACASIGINRRLPKQGKIEMAPNPAGLVDPEVTVIRFCTPAKQVKGVLFHFACHPTTTSDNRVTSEYCGAAMEELDRQLGDGISCFLQGCCGDVRPALHKDGAFFSGNERDVREAGGQLA
ncbi:MAG: hypothetical protein K0Q59_5269, partial [Paenibacillus sp.]|nr:hypothetical protein [Paenibacillus sp.]